MRRLYVFNSDGSLKLATSIGKSDSVESMTSLYPEYTLIESTLGLDPMEVYCSDGKIATLPLKPSKFHTFNYTIKQWTDPRTLADFKAQQWGKIKQSRTTAEYAGFTWGDSTFDSDQISQARITGAVTLAQMSSAFTIDWTLKDNTVRTLNQADMIAVGVALGAHVQTQFAKGQALRAQIEAATDQAGVEAVVW